KSLGVSNYGVHHLDELESYIEEGGGGKIDVWQGGIHPWLSRKDIRGWGEKRGVVGEGYCPVVGAQRVGGPWLKPVVEKYGKTEAEVLIRWSLQMVSKRLLLFAEYCDLIIGGRDTNGCVL